MKIESMNPTTRPNAVKETHTAGETKNLAGMIKLKEASVQGIQLPRNSSKEMVENFAEWYFKQGRVYESAKSYKQAISAYEKANSVEPDMSKASSVENARHKAYKA